MLFLGGAKPDLTPKYNALSALYSEIGKEKASAASEYSKLVGTNLAQLVTPQSTADVGMVGINTTNADEVTRSLSRQIRQQQKRLSILQSDFSRLDVKQIPDFQTPLVSDEFEATLGQAKDKLRSSFLTQYQDSLKKLGLKSLEYAPESGLKSRLSSRRLIATTTQGYRVPLQMWGVNDEMQAAMQAKQKLDSLDSDLELYALTNMMYGSDAPKHYNKYSKLRPSTQDLLDLRQAWRRADDEVVDTLKQLKQSALDAQAKSINDFAPLLMEAETRRQKEIAAIYLDIKNKQRLLAPQVSGRAPTTGFGD